MKKNYTYFGYFILSIYCAVLIFLEIHTSQDFVRNFFTDIQGDVPFYAVNTSLSVSFLAATSLMFVIVLMTLPDEHIHENTIKFYRSQVVFFAFLACDDRFLIHEFLGHILGINDAFLLLGLGITEISLIILWSDFREWNRNTKNNLYKAALFAALMIVIDGFFPREMIPRLSLEDLSKTWANVFIFSYSWSIFSQNISVLKKIVKLAPVNYQSPRDFPPIISPNYNPSPTTKQI